ncbi:PIN domain-containing protein [Methylibium sp.]|uniref:PIN domain-containing protein n=1 Tax=Methylibium sp. TaxID=2067992 RepID=UPI003D09F16A
MTPVPHGNPASAVIDTNAILDWLVFRESTAIFGRAIETGALRWMATPPMLLECQRLFASSSLAHWRPDAARLEAAWTRWAHVETSAIPCGPLRCTDTDDQMFIDLALARRTPWLLTRDRALLKLAKRAERLGVRIRTPSAWAREAQTIPADTHPG